MTESKELVSKEVSNEVDAKIVIEEGNLKIVGSYDGKGLGAEVILKMKTSYFLDKLAEAIPGKTDDKLIEMLKVALKIA